VPRPSGSEAPLIGAGAVPESPLPAFRARDLCRRYGQKWALAHLDLSAERGEVLLVAGPNGSGKTTLLRLLAGLVRPTSGELEVAGRKLTSDPFGWRRNVSLLSHASYLYEPLTAVETMRLWARLLGRSIAPSDLALRLAEVGLEQEADNLVSGFSAGMQKRLTFARVRLEDSDLVLLDEPFSALDAAGQELVTSWIASDRAAGKTVVIASHNLERAARIADRAVLLQRGQSTWLGAASELPGILARAS
jgi:heme exporter protein A